MRQGLEALTFVPDSAHPEGGLFYAGHQDEGAVYVFDFPIVTSAVSNTVTLVDDFVPVNGRDDLAALSYDAASDRIYAVYDSSDLMISMTLTPTLAGSGSAAWVV